jgi:hypothetical protein
LRLADMFPRLLTSRAPIMPLLLSTQQRRNSSLALLRMIRHQAIPYETSRV